MKTLELKDIAAYLPYRLNVNDSSKGAIFDLTGISTDTVTPGDFRLYTRHVDISYLACACGKNLLPLLRPMSDLTKEITHRGEEFVPMVKLANIAFPTTDWVVDKDGHCESNQGWIFSYNDDGFHLEGTITNYVPNQLQMFDKLSEWMFDYRGLIPAGLAVDANTLDKNPYEV